MSNEDVPAAAPLLSPAYQRADINDSFVAADATTTSLEPDVLARRCLWRAVRQASRSMTHLWRLHSMHTGHRRSPARWINSKHHMTSSRSRPSISVLFPMT